jgi:hypothetical protein
MDDDEIYCSEEESQQRLEFCKPCKNMGVNDQGLTQCQASGCLINLMIIMKFKACPEGNWE